MAALNTDEEPSGLSPGMTNGELRKWVAMAMYVEATSDGEPETLDDIQELWARESGEQVYWEDLARTAISAIVDGPPITRAVRDEMRESRAKHSAAIRAWVQGPRTHGACQGHTLSGKACRFSAGNEVNGRIFCPVHKDQCLEAT